MKRLKSIIVCFFYINLFAAAFLTLQTSVAGQLEPPAAPAPTMKTLDEIPPVLSQTLSSQGDDPCKTERFECVLGGEAVLDKETGLVWQQSPSSQTTLLDDFPDACQAATTGGRMGWRIPAKRELITLVAPKWVQVPGTSDLLRVMALVEDSPFAGISLDGVCYRSGGSPFSFSDAEKSIGDDSICPSRDAELPVLCVRGERRAGYEF